MTAEAERSGLLDEPWMFWLLAAAATAIGAGLRLHGLEKPSFWVDEFFTIARAGSDPLHWAQLVGYLPTWVSLWWHGADLAKISLSNITEWPALGVTEHAARLGPCWVGIATVPILALLARPVAGSGVAAVSALLVAITPWHLYWSQMARFYSLQFLFVGAFVLLFARAMQTGSRMRFAAASLVGILALLAHPTSVFVIGACFGVVVLARLRRAPVAHLAAGTRWLAATIAFLALIAASRELPLYVHGDPNAQPAVTGPIHEPGRSGWLADKVRQSWGPSVPTLVASTVQRVEPITCVVAGLWAWVAVRRRDRLGILAAAIALGVPAGVVLLSVIFPIGPRYYFPCFIGWALLAAMWTVDVDRRLAASAGRLAATSGLLALLVSVGFSAFLYTRDGAGARLRWREALAAVERERAPGEEVLRHGEGMFQAQYYLGRRLPALDRRTDVAALAPGTWVVHRTRGSRGPMRPDVFEVRGRFEIPSKPWSFVLYLLRVREAPPAAAAARHSE